jgi:hypothetical protein
MCAGHSPVRARAARLRPQMEVSLSDETSEVGAGRRSARSVHGTDYSRYRLQLYIRLALSGKGT